MSDDPTLTPRMQTTLRTAARYARRYGHSYIGTEHVLLAFLNDEGGIAPSLIEQLCDRDKMRDALEKILATPPRTEPPRTEPPTTG
jgi:ATP-dependent Clp protease ATP-binding subunit ClpA